MTMSLFKIGTTQGNGKSIQVAKWAKRPIRT
jgi:hypothetical protein